MATSGIQRVKDIAVVSIECGNRLIVDREGNVNVPTVFADTNLTVDIGGAVNFQATTINMRNAIIDFSGASITGFCGNICGNIVTSQTIEPQKVGAVAPKKFVSAELFSGSLIGDIVATKTIEEHDIGQGIDLIGTLTGDLAGTFHGQHKGDVMTSHIAHLDHSSDIQIVGTMRGKFAGIFNGDASLGYLVPIDVEEGIMVVGNFNLTDGAISAPQYRVDGKRVIGKRLPAIPSLKGAVDLQRVVEQQERILQVLRLHGLIEMI